MAGFKMDDYVDVAERIHSFYERFPEGTLKGEFTGVVEAGGKNFVVYHAQAWRSNDDPCPADGWAWEPVPGPTTFTKDSELQNAETAAWGRAIVALGFETKKIASKQEVRNRAGNSGERKQPVVKTDDDFPFESKEPDKPTEPVISEIRKLATDLLADTSTEAKELQKALGKLSWRDDPTEAQMALAKLRNFFSVAA